jgi:hypothetical protein
MEFYFKEVNCLQVVTEADLGKHSAVWKGYIVRAPVVIQYSISQDDAWHILNQYCSHVSEIISEMDGWCRCGKVTWQVSRKKKKIGIVCETNNLLTYSPNLQQGIKSAVTV